MGPHNIISQTEDIHSLIRICLNFLEEQGRSKHTLQACQRALFHLFHWYQQTHQVAINLQAVMPRDIRHWKSEQQTIEKVAPATVNQRLVAVSGFFAWAEQNDFCSKNPSDGIHALHFIRPQSKALSEIELLRLLRASRENARDYALIELLLGTGCVLVKP